MRNWKKQKYLENTWCRTVKTKLGIISLYVTEDDDGKFNYEANWENDGSDTTIVFSPKKKDRKKSFDDAVEAVEEQSAKYFRKIISDYLDNANDVINKIHKNI